MAVAWQHQAITWTNVDFLVMRFNGIHLRAIWQQVPELLFYINEFENCTCTFKVAYTESWKLSSQVYSEVFAGLFINHKNMFQYYAFRNVDFFFSTTSHLRMCVDYAAVFCWISKYPQISNIRCTKSQNLNVSCLVLQLSLRNLLKPGVKSRMKV